MPKPSPSRLSDSSQRPEPAQKSVSEGARFFAIASCDEAGNPLTDANLVHGYGLIVRLYRSAVSAANCRLTGVLT